MSSDTSVALDSLTNGPEEREDSISRTETGVSHAKSFSSSEVQDPRKMKLFSRGKTALLVKDSPATGVATSSSAPPTRSSSLNRSLGSGGMNIKIPNGLNYGESYNDLRCSPSSPSTLHRFRVWTSQHVPSKVYECVDALPQPLTMLTAPILQPPSVRDEDEESLRQYFSKFPRGSFPDIPRLRSMKDIQVLEEESGAARKGGSEPFYTMVSQPTHSDAQPDGEMLGGEFKDTTISLLLPFDSKDPVHLLLLEELWNEHHRVIMGRRRESSLLPLQNLSAEHCYPDLDREIESATNSGSSERLGTSPKGAAGNTVSHETNASQLPPRCPTPRIGTAQSGAWTPTSVSRSKPAALIPPFQLVHHEWNSPIGFQQDNPTTDFRGGGVLSLLVLLLYIIRYPEEWSLDLEQEKESGYFPAATSINVSFFLSIQCGLRSTVSPSGSAAGSCGGTNSIGGSGGRGMVFRSLLARYRLVEYVLYGTVKKRNDLDQWKGKKGDKKLKEPKKKRGCSGSFDVADSEPLDSVTLGITNGNPTALDTNRKEKRRGSSLSTFRSRKHSARPSLTPSEGCNHTRLPSGTFTPRETSFDGLSLQNNSTLEAESVEVIEHVNSLRSGGLSSDIQKDVVEDDTHRLSKMSSSNAGGSIQGFSVEGPTDLFLPPKASCPCPLDRFVLLHTLYMRCVRQAWQRSENKNLMEFNSILKNVYQEMDTWWLRYGEHTNSTHNKVRNEDKMDLGNEVGNTEKEKKRE